MKRLIMFSTILLSILAFTLSITSAEKQVKIKDLGKKTPIEYLIRSDSELSPDELTDWLKNQPTRMVTSAQHTDVRGKKTVPFIIMDIKAPEGNILQIKYVRTMIEKSGVANLLTLVGFTINYENGILKQYKWNQKERKYMIFNYRHNYFPHEGPPAPTEPEARKTPL